MGCFHFQVCFLQKNLKRVKKNIFAPEALFVGELGHFHLFFHGEIRENIFFPLAAKINAQYLCEFSKWLWKLQRK